MGLFGNGTQRMGSGYNSCLNINNWNHLFTPNSASAQQGAFACFERWARTGPSGNGNSQQNAGRSGSSSMVQYAPWVSTVNVQADRKVLEKVALITLAAVVIWFFVFRK